MREPVNYYIKNPQLRSLGLTEQVFPFSEVVSPDERRKESKAYCTSRRCHNRKDSTISSRGTYKPKAKRNEERCPDCSHYLYWSKP